MSSNLRILILKSKNCFRKCTTRQQLGIGGGGGSLVFGISFFGESGSSFDRLYDEDALKQAYCNRGELTWKERLDLMWRNDEFGNYSPELQVRTREYAVRMSDYWLLDNRNLTYDYLKT